MSNTIRKTFLFLLGSILSFTCPTAFARPGSSGTVVLSAVHAENGYIFLRANSIANPDGCANASVIRLAPASPEELDRMLSIALTAFATKSEVHFWLVGCVPSNWYPSIPQAGMIEVVD
ncbi:hypothetical protein [Sphingomonas hengshuiensis]|uniref:hypothetical protein n=1 Tax=Sphingomonas hengshuiensis TaxID=1609977 RepID=UPI0012B87E09|nr:hypothetical protein [Sphingomonas hengshuiensis]